jgi:hypothetical protein
MIVHIRYVVKGINIKKNLSNEYLLLIATIGLHKVTVLKA